jgi:hypothetical protein
MKIIKSFKTFEYSELDNFDQSLKIQVENAIEEIKPEIELYDYNVDVIELNDRKVEIHAETGGVPDEYTGYASPRYSASIDGTITVIPTSSEVGVGNYMFDGEIKTGEGQTIIVNEETMDLKELLKKVFYELVHGGE